MLIIRILIKSGKLVTDYFGMVIAKLKILWILYILIATAWIVAYKKGRQWGIIIFICGIGIYLPVKYLLTPRNVVYPENPLSAEYQLNLKYLIEASTQSPSDFSNIRGALFASSLAIVDGNDFPLLTKRLRYDFRKACRNKFFFHIFVLGGLNVRGIDQPLLEASKRLSISDKNNIRIVVVAPTTISDETKTTLEKRGIKIRLVSLTSTNNVR